MLVDQGSMICKTFVENIKVEIVWTLVLTEYENITWLCGSIF